MQQFGTSKRYFYLRNRQWIESLLDQGATRTDIYRMWCERDPGFARAQTLQQFKRQLRALGYQPCESQSALPFIREPEAHYETRDSKKWLHAVYNGQKSRPNWQALDMEFVRISKHLYDLTHDQVKTWDPAKAKRYAFWVLDKWPRSEFDRAVHTERVRRIMALIYLLRIGHRNRRSKAKQQMGLEKVGT